MTDHKTIHVPPGLSDMAPSDKYYADLRAAIDDPSAEVVPGNLIPLGYNYVMRILNYRTSRWGYTRAVVTGDDGTIAAVNRNYSSFWYCFIENHATTGHDYLLCGDDYQSFTVCDLTTGDRWSRRFEGAEDGYGWCIRSASVIPGAPGVWLAMTGCYWACPDETRVYDFTDPGSLVFLAADDDDCGTDDPDVVVDAADPYVIRFVHSIKLHKETGEDTVEISMIWSSLYKKLRGSKDDAEWKYHYEKYDEDNPDLWRTEFDSATIVDTRTGMFTVEKSERRAAKDAEREEWDRKDNERVAAICAADPIFQAAKTHGLKWGRMFQSGHDRDNGDTNTFYFTVYLPDRHETEKKAPTAKVQWGTETGAVKLYGWVYGAGDKVLGEYERTAEGFELAMRDGLKHTGVGQ